MTDTTWFVEVESGIGWSVVCCCGSKDEATKRAAYFRPMACFSGRELRIRRGGFSVQHRSISIDHV